MADQRLLISYFALSGPILMDLAAYSDLTVLVGDDLSFSETALPGIYACTRSGVTNSGAHVGADANGGTWHFSLANATGDYWGQQLPITATVGSIPAVGDVTLATAQPNYAPSKAGDAMTLTSGERTTLAAAIWNALTSGLTTVGSIGKWILDKLDVVLSTRSKPADTVARVTLVDTVTLNSDMRGTDSAALAATALSNAQWTNARAGYLDNLNVGGAVASQADINALNQSASRRVLLATVPQYERPESGTNSYTIEARLFDGDGAAVNADSTPTLTATGIVSGSLAANLSVASNPATGVYRWTYSETSAAVLEQIRIDISAVISSATFMLSAYTQSADFIAATWTTTDAANLTAVFNKLPSRAFLAGTTAASGATVGTDTITLTDASLTTAKLGAFVLAKTMNITGFNDLSASQVNTEADTALSDVGVTAARMGALTDWIDGGRLDLILDAINAAVGSSGVVLSAAQMNAVADHVRRRTQANVELSASGDTLSVGSEYGFIQQAQESSIAGSTLSIKKTDGTELGTKTLTSSSLASPVTGIA